MTEHEDTTVIFHARVIRALHPMGFDKSEGHPKSYYDPLKDAPPAVAPVKFSVHKVALGNSESLTQS
jgi:hypothetical protein